MHWLLAVLALGCQFEPMSVASGDARGADGSTPAGDDGRADGPTDGVIAPDGPPADGPPAGGGVSFAGVVTGVSADSSSVASGTLTGDGASLYLAAVATKPYTPVTGVVGLGATWTLLGDQCGARSQTGVALYLGLRATAGGAVTATLTGTPENAVVAVARYTGVSDVSPTGATAVWNALDATTCGSTNDSVDVAAYAFDLNAADGSTAFAALALRGASHDPGGAFSERSEVHNGSSGSQAGIALVDGPVAGVAGISVNGTFGTDIDAAAVAVELR